MKYFPFAFTALLLGGVLITGCSKDPAPATGSQDTTGRHQLAGDSLKSGQSFGEKRFPGPEGTTIAYTYGPTLLDTAFRFAKQHNSPDPMIVMKSYLTPVRPSKFPEHFIPAREVTMLSHNDSVATFVVKASHFESTANVELRRFVRGTDSVWLLAQVDQHLGKLIPQ